MNIENILRLENVTKSYDVVTAPEMILKGVSISISKSDALAVTGPSGSGKSTLLNIMGLLDKPSTGKVMLEGRDAARLDEKDIAAARNSEIGFIFQLHHLLPQCTALENVLVPTLVNQNQGEEVEKYARHLLDRVGLSDRLDYRPGQLSGGECQRVAVARALINRPILLLADEPTGSLDHKSAESLMNLLTDINDKDGVAMVVVTHASLWAVELEHVYELSDGVLKQTQ